MVPGGHPTRYRAPTVFVVQNWCSDLAQRDGMTQHAALLPRDTQIQRSSPCILHLGPPPTPSSPVVVAEILLLETPPRHSRRRQSRGPPAILDLPGQMMAANLVLSATSPWASPQHPKQETPQTVPDPKAAPPTPFSQPPQKHRYKTPRPIPDALEPETAVVFLFPRTSQRHPQNPPPRDKPTAAASQTAFSPAPSFYSPQHPSTYPATSAEKTAAPLSAPELPTRARTGGRPTPSEVAGSSTDWSA